MGPKWGQSRKQTKKMSGAPPRAKIQGEKRGSGKIKVRLIQECVGRIMCPKNTKLGAWSKGFQGGERGAVHKGKSAFTFRSPRGKRVNQSKVRKLKKKKRNPDLKPGPPPHNQTKKKARVKGGPGIDTPKTGPNGAGVHPVLSKRQGTYYHHKEEG